MIGIDDIAEGAVLGAGGATWGLGFAAAVAAVVVAGPRAKPLAKQAIKGYLAATERARGWTAEAGERLQDLYAEAKYEYESQLDGEHADEGEASESRPRRRRAAEAAPSEQPA